MQHFVFPVEVLVEPVHGRCSADTFTEKGFRDGNCATVQSGMLQKHDSSRSHKQSMVM